MLIRTCTMGCKSVGSKFSEDWSSLHILSTWSRSSTILSCSSLLKPRPRELLSLNNRILIKSGIELYVSFTVPKTKASVTRIASLIAKTRRPSPSGPNKSFRTGCRASFTEKSLSFLPWSNRFSSLLHL